MAHDTSWTEKVRTGGTVKLVCTICGKHVSASEKRYDAGDWIPPARH
jgi:hypothetical protein